MAEEGDFMSSSWRWRLAFYPRLYVETLRDSIDSASITYPQDVCQDAGALWLSLLWIQ